jgi:hypothetical protein
MAANEALFVYQFISTDLSPASHQISSESNDNSFNAIGTFEGIAMIAKAYP